MTQPRWQEFSSAVSKCAAENSASYDSPARSDVVVTDIVTNPVIHRDNKQDLYMLTMNRWTSDGWEKQDDPKFPREDSGTWTYARSKRFPNVQVLFTVEQKTRSNERLRINLVGMPDLKDKRPALAWQPAERLHKFYVQLGPIVIDKSEVVKVEYKTGSKYRWLGAAAGGSNVKEREYKPYVATDSFGLFKGIPYVKVRAPYAPRAARPLRGTISDRRARTRLFSPRARRAHTADAQTAAGQVQGGLLASARRAEREIQKRKGAKIAERRADQEPESA